METFSRAPTAIRCFSISLARYSEWDARFGWWAMWNNGSPQKTGQYQDLNPSPFWDIDGLSSDGNRTLNVTATGNDNETTAGKLYYYQPGLSAKVDYERYPHQLDHDPLSDFPGPEAAQSSPPLDPKIIKQDLNLGQDYAIQVQELNASFKANITDNMKVRLDVWGLKKDGVQQVNTVAMCYANEPGYGVANNQLPPDHPPITQFAGNRCHVLSQAQAIDWTTTEIKPVFEARLGDSINIEYSRPMRNFSADDQTTARYYDRTGNLSYNTPIGSQLSPFPFAVVDDTYTQMDQLKIGGDLTEDNKVYAFLMAGDTINTTNEMKRWFNNVDVRFTNTSFENVNLTGYGTLYNEDEFDAVVGESAGRGCEGDRGDDRPTHRLPAFYGGAERRLAAVRRRLHPRRLGAGGRLRILRLGAGLRALPAFVRERGLPHRRHDQPGPNAYPKLPDRAGLSLVGTLRHLHSLQVSARRPAADRPPTLQRRFRHLLAADR